MVRLGQIFSPDLFVIWVITTLIYALLHLTLSSRISRLQAYTLGLGTFLILSLAHAVVLDFYAAATHLEYMLGITSIASIAGATTWACWTIHKPTPPEGQSPDWPGLGAKRLTNVAIATIEDLASILSVVVDNTTDTSAQLAMAVELMGILRYLRTDVDPDLPMQQLRRIVMQKMGTPNKEGK